MKLIDSIVFDNGIGLKLLDMSRKIAADRWLVALACEISFPLPGEYPADDGTEDQGLYQAFWTETSGVLKYSLVKERNFIDEPNRDRILAELAGQWNEAAREYLKNQAFPARLLARGYAKFKLDYRARERVSSDEIADDEGPVDFSSCFLDPIEP